MSRYLSTATDGNVAEISKRDQVQTVVSFIMDKTSFDMSNFASQQVEKWREVLYI